MATRKPPLRSLDASLAGEYCPAAATFTLLPEDRDRVDDLRKRAAALGSVLNKSEAVRLALLATRSVKDDDLTSLLSKLTRLRPGRH